MPNLSQRNLALELVRVTEAAALAAGRWYGKVGLMCNSMQKSRNYALPGMLFCPEKVSQGLEGMSGTVSQGDLTMTAAHVCRNAYMQTRLRYCTGVMKFMACLVRISGEAEECAAVFVQGDKNAADQVGLPQIARCISCRLLQ